MQKFELVIIRPVSGKKGELVFSMTKTADNISDAVKLARRDIEGSGLIVLQAASYHDAEVPNNPAIVEALLRAHNKSMGWV